MAEKPRRTRSGGGGHRIEEVARLAGISPITVSRTLNKPETVAESTRAAVWKAIEQIGYVPNRLAGGLASNKSQTIGVVLPSITNPAFAERVQGMTDVLSPAGYNLLMGLSGNSGEGELAHVSAFLGQRVAALALTGTQHEERTRTLLKNAGIPVVEIPIISGPLIDMAVGYSADGASYAMVEHLAQCGYRRVAFLSAPVAGNQLLIERRNGYQRAVSDLGLDPDPALVIEARYSPASSARAFVDLLARRPDIDAVFCTSDLQAIGCILEAKRRGIRVPEDIGVAGYDDVELAQEFVPALTSVRFDRYGMGCTAARLLLQRIRGEIPAQSVVDIGFEVVARASTRRLAMQVPAAAASRSEQPLPTTQRVVHSPSRRR